MRSFFRMYAAHSCFSGYQLLSVLLQEKMYADAVVYLVVDVLRAAFGRALVPQRLTIANIYNFK